MLTAIDNNLLMATKLLGAQAGRTLDTITREVLAGGTNVQYAEGGVSSRAMLLGGMDAENHYMSVECIKRAVRFLKKQNAEKIDGSYVAIIHPDVAYDLTSDEAWLDVKTYCDPKDMYEGEIGKLHGVRFIETTEAKIFTTPDIIPGQKVLEVKDFFGGASSEPVTSGSAAEYYFIFEEAITDEDFERLNGKKLQVYQGEDAVIEVVVSGLNSTNNRLYVEMEEGHVISQGDLVYSGEAGFLGRDVYATFVFGANAYGTTEIKGGGLEHIVKQLGSGGTNDPLNQRATVGWKATKSAVRLVESFMVRIETTSSFDSSAA